MSSSAVTKNTAAVKLYRDILRLHRQKTEGVNRQVADIFVKYEFKLHKEAKEEFVNDFLKQWTDYRNELAERRTLESMARSISAAEIAMLSDEQLDAIDELKRATEKAINHIETDGNVTDAEEPAKHPSKPPFESETISRQ
ncbi:hypothetical protein NDN08_004794 [Rhodosorus marinus]|uniref:Succinate dehydrogenase assembly factor 3 n=1 Tax=Rhodosorus marinus TaxID=101924 RepID=A0AAV8UMG3_9RHOD|nr:hypothetical protein NDN08_004794 [Rhodosorus marinus]